MSGLTDETGYRVAAAQGAASAMSMILTSAADDLFTQYVDDLQAANRFKTFLLGAGVEIPTDLSRGLAELLEHLTSSAPSKPSAQAPEPAVRSGYSTGDAHP